MVIGRLVVKIGTDLAGGNVILCLDSFGAARPDILEHWQMFGSEISYGLDVPLVDDADEVQVLYLLAVPL